MVVLRLNRVGRKKLALYRIVAVDKRKAASARPLEYLGRYNPHTKELVIDQEAIKAWLDKGAQPSNRLAIILKNAGVKLPKWVKLVQKNKSVKDPEKAQNQASQVVEETIVVEEEEIQGQESIQAEALVSEQDDSNQVK
ncbi:30S ribosomal protein S16 [Candidatus Saccharibacteria bacterium]|nr:30S ribosomal protein S16 [Candidatus Saccharibacteria bacterium]